MGWKILLPQEIMSEGRKLLEDAGHTVIDGRGFETEDVLADFKEYQPDAMIVRITPITREVIESNPNLKVIVRHGAGFDALDVKACHDNNVQALYAPVANSTSVAETAMLLILECSRNVTVLHKTWVNDFYKAKLKVRKNTLNGKTIGLIGCGNIGSRVAKRCLAFAHMTRTNQLLSSRTALRLSATLTASSKSATMFPFTARTLRLPRTW